MFETLRSVMRFRKFEVDPVARRLARCANVEDLRELARRRLPRGVFGYIDGAAEDERTQVRNCDAFRRLEFRPRVLTDVTDVDTSTTVLGKRLKLPLVLAPTGFSRIAHSEGELAVARAAARAGITYSLSTLGTRSIEEVAAVNDGAKWFEVYVWKDRGLVKELLERAREAGFEAIQCTGFGMSAVHLGLPDYGFLSMNEMVELSQRIAAAVELPVMADANMKRGPNA